MRQMYNLCTLDEFVAGGAGLHCRAFLAGAEIDRAAMAELVVDAAIVLHRGRGAADRGPAAGLEELGLSGR